MSLLVPRKILDRSKEEMIISMLTFRIGEDKFQYQSGTFGQQVVEPIPFFHVEKDSVCIPLFFAKKLMKKEIEEQKVSLPIHSDFDFQFTKQLFQHQQPIADQALEKLQNCHAVLLNLFTGFGKTIMGAYLSSIHRKPQPLRP